LVQKYTFFVKQQRKMQESIHFFAAKGFFMQKKSYLCSQKSK